MPLYGWFIPIYSIFSKTFSISIRYITSAELLHEMFYTVLIYILMASKKILYLYPVVKVLN
jgi:hypothetical protein